MLPAVPGQPFIAVLAGCERRRQEARSALLRTSGVEYFNPDEAAWIQRVAVRGRGDEPPGETAVAISDAGIMPLTPTLVGTPFFLVTAARSGIELLPELRV